MIARTTGSPELLDSEELLGLLLDELETELVTLACVLLEDDVTLAMVLLELEEDVTLAAVLLELLELEEEVTLATVLLELTLDVTLATVLLELLSLEDVVRLATVLLELLLDEELTVSPIVTVAHVYPDPGLTATTLVTTPPTVVAVAVAPVPSPVMVTWGDAAMFVAPSETT